MGFKAYGLALVVFVTVCACRQRPSAASTPLTTLGDVEVPMRDGVVLRANVWLPDSLSADKKYPVLLYRTPYGKDDRTVPGASTPEEGEESYYKEKFSEMVARGYVLVVQDVRGRYKSGGEFTPYVNEGKDGFDTIEWAAAQPWSNGKVGTFGVSYPGAVQWLAAVEAPPHLVAMVPAMTFSNMNQFIYYNGVFDIGWINWIWNLIAPELRLKRGIIGPQSYAQAEAEWARLKEATFYDYLQLDAMDKLHDVAPYYYEWLKHPPYDPYWNWGDVRLRYGAVQAAVLHISGWYDEPYGTEGAVTNFLGIRNARGGNGDHNRLIIGPWLHGVYETEANVSGKRQFGTNAKISYNDTILEWMDYHLKGLRPAGKDLPWPTIRAYQMGEDQWLSGADWPLATSSATFELRREGTAKIGTLVPSATAQVASAAATTTFTSDPRTPVTENPDENTVYGAYDLRRLAERPDVLTFETPALTADLRVTGAITAQVSLSCDCRDTDLYVKVLDVAPDGTAYNLMSPGHEVLRASYRSETAQQALLESGDVVTLNYKHMLTGNTFKAGHKIRIAIMATFFPDYSRNLHTGLSESHSAEAQPAKITIHHTPEQPSRITLSLSI